MLVGCSGNGGNEETVQAPEPIIYITGDEFVELLDVVGSVIYFGDENCPICYRTRPNVYEAAQNLEMSVFHYDLYEGDFSNNDFIMAFLELGITGTPTVVIVHEDDITLLVGYHSVADFEMHFEQR